MSPDELGIYLILLPLLFLATTVVSGPGQLVKKPVSWLRPDPNQPRKYFDPVEEALLGASLRNKQHVPCIATSAGVIIDGERRWRAAKAIGLETIDVIITDENLTPSQIKEMQLVTAMQRSDLSGYEKWTGCAELMCMNPTWQMKDLAEHLHLDPSMITRLLSPSKCIEAAQNALRDGLIGISDCYALSKLELSEQSGLLALRLSGSATRDQLEQAGRKARKTSNGTPTTTQTVKRIKCHVPGKDAIVVVSGEAISLEAMIEAMVELLKLAKRESEKGLDAKTFERVCRDLARKG